jgi:CRISPR-associated endonuclease/helicase Cas3
MGQEVVLVAESTGGFQTVDGLRLGPNGDAARDRPEEVLGASVRLPAYLASEPDVQGLAPLPGWEGDPWLGSSPALRLDREGFARIGGWSLRYQAELGLVIERGRR